MTTKARIQVRIEPGNLGDHKSVGGGVRELRIDFGPGYRVYFGKDGATLILLLIGGDKGNQGKDIKRAQALWSEYLKGGSGGQKK
jgi:putative addiction module killer protein